MVVGHDSGGELRVLDKQLLTEQAADTHTHTHTRRGDAPMVDVDASRGTAERAEPNLTGEQFLMYWLWRCRSNQMDWSLHPLRQYDPLDADNITLTQL